ncbi:MAG TPA: ABC transporter permease [Bryobacteraceae bacterium]|nr:ABC transporter permease [Bryobacteraceae bacterium]
MRHDLVYAMGALLRRPGFALAAILSLALGIGVTVAIFSVVNAVALRPLPYRDSDRLVWFSEVLHGTSTDELTITPHFLEWRRQAQSFASIAGYNYQVRNLTGAGDAVELPGARVSASLLPMIGVEPALGRNFTTHEDSKGNDRVAILTDPLWRTRFASDPKILGRPILLDGLPYIVVGVLPPGFVFPGIDPVDLLTPLGKDPAERPPGISLVTNVIGRLNPQASIRQADAELTVINSHLIRLPWAIKITVDMHPLRDHLYGNAKTAGWVLLAAAGFLLWIACANVSNLLLARLTERDRELAIRAVLGGSRARLIAQLLTESSLLAVVACTLGTAIAFALRGAILALTPYKFAGFESLPFDWRVFSFAIFLGIATVLLFGVLPAFRATQGRLAESVKSGEAAIAGGRGSTRVLSTLAAAEIATLLILATGAGVTLKSFWKMRYQNLGVSPDRLVVAEIVLSGPHYYSTTAAPRDEFIERLLDRAQSIPGVESVAVTDWGGIPPGGGHAMNVFEIEGRPADPVGSGHRPIARYPQASPNLFAILQIPLLKGRLFDSSDRPEVAVINRVLAERYFPGENPLGHRVRFGGPDAPWFEIIGIVGDVKLSGLDAAPEPAIYYPESREDAIGVVGLILESPLNASILAGEIRKTVAALDPSQAVSVVESLNTRLSESVSKPRFLALLLNAFAALAGVLGILGVYGVVSCRVRWQMRELAVRQALGAEPGDVMRLVLGQGFAIIAIGIAVGIAGSLALSRLLATLVYQVRPNDPMTLASAAIVLSAAALMACWFPARRATRVDPLALLRYE